MADFNQLKADVANQIKTNGVEAITGAVMQDVLLTIINSIADGYMFGGVAQHSGSVGNPDYNVFYLGGSGSYTGYGGSIDVPAGSYCVFAYDGTWHQSVIDLGISLGGTVSEGETQGVTGDAVNTALNTLWENITNILDSIEFSDDTSELYKGDRITQGMRVTVGGALRLLSSFTILAATVQKAGLMSAADKRKLDNFVLTVQDMIETMTVSDVTAAGDTGTRIDESIGWTVDEVTHQIATFTLLAATAVKAGLMSNTDKQAVDALFTIEAEDTTAVDDLGVKLTETLNWTVNNVSQIFAEFTLLAATQSKAGLMSAADKAKLDAYENNIRSMEIVDTTGDADKGDQITETLRWVFGGVSTVITTFTLLAATNTKAGLMSAVDKQLVSALLTIIAQDTTAQADEKTSMTQSLKWTRGGTQQTMASFSILAATAAKAGLMSADDKVKLDAMLTGGYMFAGVATTSTNPTTGTEKMFYIAIEAGEYTHFDGLTIDSGINILMYDGSDWSAVQVVGIDDKPTAGSNNLVKSGGVAQEFIDMRVKSLLIPFETTEGYVVTGSVGQAASLSVNQNMAASKYNVVAGKAYTFSAKQTSGYNVYVIFWVDTEGIIISREYLGIAGQVDTWENVAVTAPEGAATMWMNVQKSQSSETNFKEVTDELIQVHELEGKVDNNKAALSRKNTLIPFESNEGYYARGDVGQAPDLISNQGLTTNKYNVIAGKAYTFSAKQTSGYNVYVIFWVDTEGIIISREYLGIAGQVDTWENVAVTAPEGAATMWMNVQNTQSSVTNFKEVLDELMQVQELEEKVDDSYSEININRSALSKKILLTPFETIEGYFVAGDVGQVTSLVSNSGTRVNKYDVVAGKTYTFSTKQTSAYNIFVVNWIDAEGVIISKEYKGTSGQLDTWEDVAVTAPENAATMWMNVQKSQSSETNFKEVTDELIQSDELQQQIDALEKISGIMKVVINGIGEMTTDSVLFYIRTAYNLEKDIIITHRINSNGLITFQYAYIGDKSLTDVQLMTDTYLVSSHTDSTSPLRSYTQYWHLFAQHGYPVPYFPNSVGMTSADVGAEWKDQLDRRYKIGKVTDSYIWLLPVIYQDANGHYTRDWHSMATSTTITSLTHVSGGSYTQQISVSSISQEQLRPIMEVANRTFIIDGNTVSEPGTYYANELNVSETEIGYDPATINDWFGGIEGNPNLTGAQKHAVFTYNYNYKGAQCSVNTTIHCLREAMGYYGGTQQQFFFDNGDYKAMFMIPKAAARDGIELDKPFNSPSSSSTGYSIYRSQSHLKDINDPVDRQIGMLHNPTNDTYLVGIAAGLSLVKGDTIKNKRNQICLEDSLLMSFSPSNINKFYVSGINTSAFESGYYPAGYFKEVDYYVSYFDPAENEGQVYWYKDGSRYVIYCHCQSIQNVLAINVPTFMDGLKLSIVEKTADTELLSDTIANGKLFVNYNTADANYIVLIAE